MELKEYIIQNYGKENAEQIANKFGVTKSKVYREANKLNVKTNKTHNKTFSISQEAEQIILSGILGDGNIRKMGNGAVYREKHGKEEFEYCKWKNNMLGALTKDKKMYLYKDEYLNFDTYNTSQLLKYKNMTYEEIIENLNDFGIALYLLDDGWTRQYTNHQSFLVESKIIPLSAMIKLKEKIEKIFGLEVRIHTRVDTKNKKEIRTLNIINNEKIKAVCEKYNMNNLDVFKKKFEKQKCL